MDLVNIRKKAQQGKGKESKEEDSAKNVQDRTGASPEQNTVEDLKFEQEISNGEETDKTTEDTHAVTKVSADPEVAKEKKETQEAVTSPFIEETEVEVISFKLGEELYGVNVDRIKEILKPPQITPVPRAPHYLEGVTSLRGEVIPVFNLKKRFGLEGAEEEKKKRILILSVRNEIMGAVIDEVKGVIRLLKDSIELPPTIISGVEADFLEGVSRVNDHFIGLLNIDEVMKI